MLGFLWLSTIERTKENKNISSKIAYFKHCHVCHMFSNISTENGLKLNYKIWANQTISILMILIHAEKLRLAIGWVTRQEVEKPLSMLAISDNFLTARLLKLVACRNRCRDEWARWSCFCCFACLRFVFHPWQLGWTLLNMLLLLLKWFCLNGSIKVVHCCIMSLSGIWVMRHGHYRNPNIKNKDHLVGN